MEGRVLVTTYVRTLPQVMAALMQRLAPDVVDRIDFRSVHEFARDVLVQRGRPVAIETAPPTGSSKTCGSAKARIRPARQDRPDPVVLAGRDRATCSRAAG